MSATTDYKKTSVLIAAGVASLLLGLAIIYLDLKWLSAALVGVIAVGLVFHDYRVGVVCLTVLLPWSSSPLLPQTYGFNLINFLMLASISALIAQRRSKPATVKLPRIVLWCYLLPVLIAAVVAWPHLPQGVANFPPLTPGESSVFEPQNFLKTRVIKPLFYVLFAYLLGNAVRDSKVPERLLVPFLISAVIPAFAIVLDLLMNGGTVTDRTGFLQELGLHPNEYGMQLSLAAGPLLFVAAGSGSRLMRFGAGLSFAAVSIGLLLTGSRGAALSYTVILTIWLLQRRKFSDFVIIVLFISALYVVVPDAFLDRLTLGLDEVGAPRTNDSDDQLSKGRFSAWTLLGPEVLDSPIWGEGIGSTAWNAATTAGRYGAAHPHNLYLEILLDIGLAGFIVIMYLYYRYARAFQFLSRSSDVSPTVQDFFRGALASILGMSAMAMTNGHWMPHPEQTFLWFSLGFAFGYWHLIDESRRTSNPTRRQKHLNQARLGRAYDGGFR